MDVDIGSRVRIDIPDEADPDHRHHGKHGEVEHVISDDADRITGNTEDSSLIRVKLDEGTLLDVRGRDLRPPFK